MLTETMPLLAASTAHATEKVAEVVAKAPKETFEFMGVFELDSYQSLIHPAFILMAGALLTIFLPKLGRQITAVATPALAFIAFLMLSNEAFLSVHMLNWEFTLLRMDEAGMVNIFAYAFTIYGVIAGIYSWSQPQRFEKMTALYLSAGGMGVILCGDLITLYFFWEVLTVASLILVWFGRTEESKKAAFRYVMLHLAGGVCLLSGALILINQGHEGGIEKLDFGSWPTWLLLIGMMVNAGVPPLHAWLPDAYPRASVYGTVYLGAYTTKSAVFILAMVFAGTEIVIWLGAIMAVYGGVFAVLENNMRKLLSYHIVSQVGFIVCAIGIGSDLALAGAAAHTVTNIFYKGLLMMGAGAVLYAVGSEKLHALGGLSKSMKLTFIFFLVGGLSISGAPLFNGFVSKGLIMDAAYKEHLGTVELLLSVGSMISFLSICLKMTYFCFLGENRGGTKVEHPVPKSMLVAMGTTAFLCILTGIPYGSQILLSQLPYFTELAEKGFMSPYSYKTVVKSLQLMGGTILVFWVLLKIVEPHAKLSLDIDRIYRFLVPTLVRNIGITFQTLGVWWEALVDNLIKNFTDQIKRYKDHTDHASIAASVTASLAVIAIIALAAWMAVS